MSDRRRRLVYWILLLSSPIVFVWAANYFVHPVRILLVTGVVVLAALVIRPREGKRR
jgi:hypothetical protein